MGSNPENRFSHPASQLDSRQLQCLQQMGITVWQRRSQCDATAEVSDAEAQSATNDQASTELTTAVSTTDTPEQQTQGLTPESMALMSVHKSPADVALAEASVIIVRTQGLQKSVESAPVLNNDEYQLLKKMMEAISLQPDQWISACETRAEASVDTDHVAQLLGTSGAVVLLVLLPASELGKWLERWADLKPDNQSKPNHQIEQASSSSVMMLKTEISGNPVAVAPLCDPADLLLNGSLKRDAWECLKRVKAVLAQQVQAEPV